MTSAFPRGAAFAAAIALFTGTAFAAGLPLGITEVDNAGLPDVGDEWLTENPYRDAGHDVWVRAIEVGESAFTQNCARCHGLGAISGGLAPDLRMLQAADYDDEWFTERFQQGMTQGGITKMPAFADVLSQKTAWAIRTYIETRPDDQAVLTESAALKDLRDELDQWAKGEGTPDDEAMKTKLDDIATRIPTLSGAPVADSVAFHAASQLDGTPASYGKAAETLTVGLSVHN
ncbi:cytochrome c-550 PedF [Loktanella sp. M215]|uniref:cytochrome c-550 PedF n=1 Tax=Loktanella sp. M215 TaxID=2675431 RepID=UPI001F00728B|nr:cytochrome c-550 PedF [Loktanella sp. M215]MBU2358050.1 cytochrome c-550 PedF [Alphaproteobacteria bacterium]MCF7701844.1 cytochrome c-550 PedF [Loktanella sp. M215]